MPVVDAHAVTLRGASGSLTWAYRTAATLGDWTITKMTTGWVLVAQARTLNAYDCKQSPLLFVTPTAHGFWTWPVRRLTITDQTLRAELGPPVQG